MAPSYKEIHHQLTTLLHVIEKHVSSKNVLLKKEQKNKLLIRCRDIIKELESHQNDTSFDLAEFISETLELYAPKKKSKQIPKKFYKKLGELYHQLMSCDDVADIIKRKGIEPFDQQKVAIQLADDISEHSKLLFRKVYSKPHILDKAEVTEINRDLHGIEHVNRAAYYIPVLVNLYRRYWDAEAEALTSEDVKLIQIAALCHDLAREKGDGPDYWDQDSALLAFHYFSKVLHVPDAKAKLLAEAIANKDMKDGKYYRLVTNLNGELTWEPRAHSVKNIYQKVLHDADSLDILRARSTNNYNAEYLDFYQNIAKENPQAKAEMTELIYEIRSLIESQGDGFLRQKYKIKKYYEHAKGYQRTVAQIAASEKLSEQNYHLLHALYIPDIDKLPLKQLQYMRLLKTPINYDPEHVLDEINLRAALDKGIVFARGIADPSAIVNKKTKNIETQAELEIRKTLRRVGKATRTQKADRLMKHGNPNRSVALVGFGAVPFAAAGFLIVDNDLEHKKISSIAKTNIVSGFGKKKNIAGLANAIDDKKQKAEAMQDLIATLQIGGGSNKSAHSEIIYHTECFDAVYFTQDAVFANKQMLGSAADTSEPFHKHAALLQAIYLQKQYEQQSGIKLSIFEYSGIHRFVKKQDDLSDAAIASLFMGMYKDYISAQLSSGSPELFRMTLEQVKIFSMYGDLHAVVGRERKNLQAADTYLPEEIRKSINQELEDEIQKARHIALEKIRTKSQPLFSPMAFTILKSMNSIPKDLHAMIIKKINSYITREDFFQKQLTDMFDQIQAKTASNKSENMLDVFQYLENYSELIGKSTQYDKFKQMISDLVNNYLKNNIDKIMKQGLGTQISLCARISNIMGLLSLNKRDEPDLFVDFVIRISKDLKAFHHLEPYVYWQHPRVLAHVQQLVAKLPSIPEHFDIADYVFEARKYELPNLQLYQGVSIYIDKLQQANRTISAFALYQVLDAVSFQEKNERKEMRALFHCTQIESLKDLVDILTIVTSKHSYISQHQLSDILDQFSQNLFAQFQKNPNFYLFHAYESHENFIVSVAKLHPIKLSANYKANMLMLIKMAPDNEKGLYFVERIRKLNSQLGFDVDLQANSAASAATAVDKENMSPQYTFFDANSKNSDRKKKAIKQNNEEQTEPRTSHRR